MCLILWIGFENQGKVFENYEVFRAGNYFHSVAIDVFGLRLRICVMDDCFAGQTSLFLDFGVIHEDTSDLEVLHPDRNYILGRSLKLIVES